MTRLRCHPLALVTAASGAWLATEASVVAGAAGLQRPAAIAALLLPQAVLLWAHVRRANGWKQDLWLALCAIVISCLGMLAAVYLAWFRPGWPGVFTFSVLLSGLAVLCMLPVRKHKPGGDARRSPS